jgi:transcriptional regulator with XRE-family HTH domain
VAQPVDADAQVVFSRALCAQLRDARRRLGLTQAQLSARTGGLISKAALANYETGHRSMRVDIFWALARALDTEPGVLMAAAERSAGMTADAQSPGPVTIEIHRLMANADPRLAAARKWFQLRYPTNRPATETLDTAAVSALAALADMAVDEFRRLLARVAGATEGAQTRAAVPASGGSSHGAGPTWQYSAAALSAPSATAV